MREGLAAEGALGSATLVEPGNGDPMAGRAVVALRREPRKLIGGGANLVITMADGRITAMEEHRRLSKARRLAQQG